MGLLPDRLPGYAHTWTIPRRAMYSNGRGVRFFRRKPD